VNYKGRPMKKRQHTWGKTLKRAGITRRLRPYDLRHYFVTKALEDGADIKALAEVVGAARLQKNSPGHNSPHPRSAGRAYFQSS